MHLNILILIKTAKKPYSAGPFCNGQLSIHTCCVLHKMTCAGLSFVQYKETNFRQIKTSHIWYRRHLFHPINTFQTKDNYIITLFDHFWAPSGQIVAIVSDLDGPDIIMIIYILYKHNNYKKCFKNELNSQFRVRSGPILSDPVIRPDLVNTRTG